MTFCRLASPHSASATHHSKFPLENNGDHPLNNQCLQFTFNLPEGDGPSTSTSDHNLVFHLPPILGAHPLKRKGHRAEAGGLACVVLALSLKPVWQDLGDPGW